MRLFMGQMFALALGFALLSGADLPKAMAEQTSRTEQQKQAEGTLEKRLKELGRDLDQLGNRMNTAAEKARDEMQQSLKDLKSRHKDAEKGLEDLRKSAGAAWEKTKAALDQAVKELQEKYDKLRKKEEQQ
ncbi:MAG: hypothetical protein M0042_11975 [Nitrospiraceae bacterium]|nr:hypothetical protein [Nitrospiraceae bacterium]